MIAHNSLQAFQLNFFVFFFIFSVAHCQGACSVFWSNIECYSMNGNDQEKTCINIVVWFKNSHLFSLIPIQFILNASVACTHTHTVLPKICVLFFWFKWKFMQNKLDVARCNGVIMRPLAFVWCVFFQCNLNFIVNFVFSKWKLLVFNMSTVMQ